MASGRRAAGLGVALAKGAAVFPREPRFWGLLAADGLCVGLGVTLIPFASRYLGRGELAMILLGEIAVAQVRGGEFTICR